jgi:putative ABC transport system permease protein
MRFPLYLAVRNLLRNPGRNLLYILGVSITAALLLDMILLSSGIRVTLERVLKQMGYELRLSPRGALPFETEAQIYGFQNVRSKLLQFPTVEHVDALLGTTVSVDFSGQTFTSFALGLELHRKVMFHILQGKPPAPGSREVVINKYLAEAKKIRPGDRLTLRMANETQAIGVGNALSVPVSGIASFELDAEGQYTISCPLSMLQELMDQKSQDPVSVILVKLKDASQADQIAATMNKEFPQISAFTVKTVIQAVDKQLSYFKQFAFILGGISLVTTFVLVFIITTISFHDRLGEVALLRAIGLSHRTIFITVLFEGMLTSLASAIFGFLLGKLVAIYLDVILKSAPGLPEDFSFFVMEPQAVVRAFVILIFTGIFAGLYPAAAAIRLPVADTLREEIL